LKTLNQMIWEVLTNDRSEIRTINRQCLEIIMKLLFEDQEKLEYYSKMLGKRISQLEEINNECHYYMGELWNEVTSLNQL